MIRATASFAAVALALIAAICWLMMLLFPGTEARHAIVVSGVMAFVVQLFAFVIARISAPSNMLAGWGVGMLLRFVVLVGYALVAYRTPGLPLAPALISLASCFFVTSLAEPVLLKT